MVKEVTAELHASDQEELVSLRRTVDEYTNKNTLGAFTNVLGNQWKVTDDTLVRGPILVDDPVHGCIPLDSVLATIIAQPIIQRLSRVRQLSFSYTHFPSANHSRLSHVLGVARNVEAALNGIFSRGVYFVEGQCQPLPIPDVILNERKGLVQRAKLVAILHDLGHGPFGHALDNYVGYVNKHHTTANPDKIYSRLYIDRYLRRTLLRFGFDPNELNRILNPEERADLNGFDALIGELVDSPMDMDRMDYLTRDAHMTGLSMGFTNAEALIQLIRPLKVGDAYLLSYDSGAVEYMEHLLYAREAMYRSCYEHPRKRAAERVLEKLMREISEDNPDLIDDLYILTDEELLSALRLVNLRTETARHLLKQLMTNSEYIVVHDVQANSPNISEEAKLWVKGSTKGKGKASYIDRPAELEDRIARGSVGADRKHQIHVIVAPPAAYNPKFNAATILFQDEDGTYQTDEFFNFASQAKEVLSAMNPSRARIRVMCPVAVCEDDLRKIKLSSIEELGR